MNLKEFKLERFFAKYEFSAPYILCSSDPQSFSIEEILSLESGSEIEFKKTWLGYTETKGSPPLREEISKTYLNISKDEILTHSGGEEGIFLFMNSILEKGDHVIAIFPAYQSLYSIAESIGCEVTFWKLIQNENNSFNLDLNFLKENIKKNTKAIIINFPHNPTGFLPSKTEFQEIIDIAKKNNIYLFSDEVYKYLEHDSNTTLTSACDLYENAVSLGATSKAYSLPGLRIGWIASKNKKILEKIWTLKDYTSICSSAPSEFLAGIAIRNRKKIFERNLKLIRENLNLLNSFFKKHEDFFIFSPPKATSITFPRLRDSSINVEDFCVELVESQGVFLLPSTKYDYGYSNFRIGFGRKNFKECLEQFEKFIVNKLTSFSNKQTSKI